MAVTRLERKGRKNKNVAKNRVDTIRRLNSLPSIKNVDIEEIKKEFANQAKETPKEKTGTEKKEEAPKVESVAVEAPAKEEKKAAPGKETAKKAPAKKVAKEEDKAEEKPKATAKKKAAPKAEKKEPARAKNKKTEKK